MPPKGPPQPSEEQMQAAMNDMQHMAMRMQPSPADPNAPVTLETIILACASSPGMIAMIPASHPSKTEEVEEALKKADIKIDWIKSKGMDRKNAIFLTWKLNRQRADLKKTDDELDVPTQQHMSACQQIALKLLMQVQMLLPHQGWVAAAIGVARASALFANQVWSHTDQAALDIMGDILKGEGLRPPKLRLESKCEPAQAKQGASVKVQIKLHRDHHGFEGKKPPKAADPSGVYEAYWLYVILCGGEKETPDSFLAVQPLTCKQLEDETCDAVIKFNAPAKPGSQKIKIFVTSTSTVGVDLDEEISFQITGEAAPAEDAGKAVEKLSLEDDDIGIKM